LRISSVGGVAAGVEQNLDERGVTPISFVFLERA
jgi:hypothetical protein